MATRIIAGVVVWIVLTVAIVYLHRTGFFGVGERED